MLTLKKNRILRKLTQADLAHILGVSVATISRWEHGHHVPTRLAQKVIDAWIVDRNEFVKKEVGD